MYSTSDKNIDSSVFIKKELIELYTRMHIKIYVGRKTKTVMITMAGTIIQSRRNGSTESV